MHIRFFTGCDPAHVALRKRLRECGKSAFGKCTGDEREARAKTKNRPVSGGLTSAGK